MKTAIFIDAGYLQKAVAARIDYRALALTLGGLDCRVFYYDCMPITGGEAKEGFLNALEAIPGFVIRLGVLREVGEPKHFGDTSHVVQKMVDVEIALDMVEAAQRGVEKLVLISGDCDLVPAVQRARERYAWVTLVHSAANGIDRTLWNAVDDRVQMTPEWVRGVERKAA